VKIAERGSNISGRFLEVAMYAVGGQRSLIMIPEGREGWGWSQFAVELSKVKVYIDSMVGSSAVMLIVVWGSLFVREERGIWARVRSTGVRSFVGGETSSFAEVVSSAKSLFDKENRTLVQTAVVRVFHLFPLSISKGIEVVRSVVNCFDFEKKLLGLLDKKLPLDPLDKNHAKRDGPSD
jgi:hypothetical protein